MMPEETMNMKHERDYTMNVNLFSSCWLNLLKVHSLGFKILAYFSREGLIKESGDGILNDINYYSTVTIYRLIAPLATYRLLRDKLTSLDMELDERIKNQYTLVKDLIFYIC